MFIGIVEGFYGKPWRLDQRIQMFKLMKSEELNIYIYAPKDDAKHRAQWRMLYTNEEILRLKSLKEHCDKNNIHFVYSLAPGLSWKEKEMNEEIVNMEKKLKQLIEEVGVVDFALLFDDLDLNINRTKLATLHIEISTNFKSIIESNLKQGKPELFFCPTPYCDAFCSLQNPQTDLYITTIAKNLDVQYNILYTGSDIISKDVSNLESIFSIVPHKIVLWDNIYANDYDMRRCYLGLYRKKYDKRLSGIVLNPNNEYELNYVPVVSFARTLTLKSVNIDEIAKQWQEQRFSNVPLDLIKLCIDIFNMPFENGKQSSQFISDVSAFMLSNISSNSQLKDKLLSFTEKVVKLYDYLTCIQNRDLLYDIYPYIWEIKEEMLLWQFYLTKNFNSPLNKFKSPEHHAGIYRGGVVSELRSLLNFDQKSEMFQPTPQLPLKNSFKIRQATLKDMKAVYRVCLKTGAAGCDATNEFPNFPDLLGDMFIGPYITFSTKLCFVLLNSNDEIVGYTAGVADSSTFWKQFFKEWHPKLLEKYPSRIHDPKTLEDEFINYMHDMPNDILNFPKFPAHLHIDIMEEGQGRGNGTKLMQMLLSEMKVQNVPAVHLVMDDKNERAHKFYKKLGFFELMTKPGDIVMAMIF